MITMRRVNRGILTTFGLCLTLGGVLRAQEDATHAGHSMSMDINVATHESLDNFHGIAVEFELLDRDGNLVSDEDFRGQYILLGFGFTHCAHICPMMALNMGKALSMAEIDAIGIFVSVDTERDTPSRTDDYASNFGERMLGLGGSFEQINTAASNFKVSYAVTKTQNNYTVQHTANVYVIDPEGGLADVLTFSTTPEDLLAAMQ